jgi:inorganic triphosphatase YgiF
MAVTAGRPLRVLEGRGDVSQAPLDRDKLAPGIHAPRLGYPGPGTLSLQIEREIAFDVDDLEDVADALRAGALGEHRVVDESQADQLTTYFDTVGRLLAERKYSLRTRRFPDGRTVVTLKFPEVSKSDALRARPELEEVFGPGVEDATIWASLPARLGRECADDEPLMPDLYLATRRHVLRCSDGVQVFDVALDLVTLPNFSDYARPVIEIEIVEGTRSDLLRLGGMLSRLPTVHPSQGGKRAHARAHMERAARVKKAG